MAMATGLLALLVLGAEGPTASGGGETISYQVRVATLDGLAWRTSAYARLRPVARQGAATVWTADRALASKLAGSALDVTVIPKCSLASESTVGRQSSTYFVEHCERVADGPINQASAVAWKPEVARVDEGFQSRVTGRKLDQGILARVSLEETHVKAIHVYDQSETVHSLDRIGLGIDLQPSGPGTTAAKMVMNLVKGEPTRIACRVQVPEVSQSKVDGEWLIPHDGVLLVSLGVETVADDQGKAVVRDRVAILEFSGPTAPKPTTPTPVSVAPTGGADGPPVLVGALPMPALPGRSVPQGFNPQGEPVELPPLPESVASADLDRIKPEPFQPSPQTTPVTPEPLPVAVASADLDRIKPEAPRTSAGALPVASAPVADDQVARSGFAITDRLEAAGQGDRKAESSTLSGSITTRELLADHSDLLGKLLEAIDRAGLMVALSSDCASVNLCPRDNPTHGDELCPLDDATTGPKKVATAEDDERIALDFTIRTPFLNGLRSCLESLMNGNPIKLNVGNPTDKAEPVSTPRLDLSAALKTPGRTETAYIALGGNLTLEIKATVVPTAPARLAPVVGEDRHDQDGFWFLTHPSRMDHAPDRRGTQALTR